jgi:tetratricopeptide (TPR) repeat protein
MKTIIQKTLLLITVVVLTATFALGQRVIKGTVYLEGKPAAGITVEAQRGTTKAFTSFDGKYEVKADSRTSWLRFTYVDQTKRYDIPANSGDEIDFYFDNIKPVENQATTGGVVLKSQEELLKEQNREYMNELSMFNEFSKQEDYKSALPHWRNIYSNYPKSHLNVYIQGARMHQAFIDRATAPDEKEKNLQELMKIYDNRIRHFGDRGYVLGRKGVDWLKFYVYDQELEGETLKEKLKSGYEWISESVKEQGIKTEAPVLVLLMRTSVALFRYGELTKETVISNYDKSNTIINAVIAENADADQVSRMKEIQPFVETIFETSGAADCEALVNIYTPQYQEKSNDINFIKTMLLRLGRTNCDESELFAQATEKLYELEPSALAAYNMARRFIKRNDIPRAKEYYKMAMEQETDKDLLATYYLQYAKVLYTESAFSEARNYARKVLDINPSNCEAKMLIGDIYVSASRTFTGTSIQKAAIFWVAVDYYNDARSGEDCAIEAAQKANEYRRYFPSKENAFMEEGLQEGQSYKVEGWINETTRVRF